MRDQQQNVGCSLVRKPVQASAHSLPKAVYPAYSVIYSTYLSYFAKVFSMGSGTPAPGLVAMCAAVPAAVPHSCP